MSPDEISAFGSVSAFVVAALALGVSVYAAVVARRGARSTERQAEIAASAYRIQAAPKILLRLDAWADGHKNAFFWKVNVVRVGGPIEVRWRFDFVAILDTDAGTTPIKLGPRYSPWLDGLGSGREEKFKEVVEVPPGETPRGFVVAVEVQIVEAPRSGAVSEDALPWTHSERLTWSAGR
ncbi:hypothetical protein [Actinomycetospora atypica]|uniref:Uncharacterized protein n=1 Tax=Actinomycetospora atypica TaxID=1290095 RepID=A0ABV9YGG0_9PSEU